MGIWIENDDVKERWDSASGAIPKDSLIDVTINDTEDYLIVAGGTEAVIQARIDSGAITKNTVESILSRAVIRTLQTPQNSRLTSWNEGISGAFNQSQSLAEGPRNQTLLTSYEVSKLTGDTSGEGGSKMGALTWVGAGYPGADSFAYNTGHIGW